MSESIKPTEEFQKFASPGDLGKSPENQFAPPVEVVDHNLDGYPEAHKAEVIEAFKAEEQNLAKTDAA